MDKSWTGQARASSRASKDRKQRAAEAIRNRRKKRRQEWVKKPVRTLLRQVTGRR